MILVELEYQEERVIVGIEINGVTLTQGLLEQGILCLITLLHL